MAHRPSQASSLHGDQKENQANEGSAQRAIPSICLYKDLRGTKTDKAKASQVFTWDQSHQLDAFALFCYPLYAERLPLITSSFSWAL
jgi:hypothetical protein